MARPARWPPPRSLSPRLRRPRPPSPRLPEDPALVRSSCRGRSRPMAAPRSPATWCSAGRRDRHPGPPTPQAGSAHPWRSPGCSPARRTSARSPRSTPTASVRGVRSPKRHLRRSLPRPVRQPPRRQRHSRRPLGRRPLGRQRQPPSRHRPSPFRHRRPRFSQRGPFNLRRHRRAATDHSRVPASTVFRSRSRVSRWLAEGWLLSWPPAVAVHPDERSDGVRDDQHRRQLMIATSGSPR